MLGFSLVDHLINCGHHVRGLVRRYPASERFPNGVDICQGDLGDRRALDRAVKEVDVVFHLAAKLHVNNPPPHLSSEFERVNVEGTRNLVASARSAKVKRLVFFSTINVYGNTENGSICDEETPLCPDSIYSETKAEAEKIVLQELPAVVLRLAAVYGPRMKGNYPKLLNALRKGRFLIVGDGLNRRTLVYEHDVCEAALLAAQHPNASGQVYNVTDGQVHNLNDVIAAMCAALGKKPPGMKLPKGLARNAFGFLEDISGLFGLRSPVGRATVDKLTEDLAVKGDKMRQELGFKPKYDLFSGWQECVRLMVEDESAATR